MLHCVIVSCSVMQCVAVWSSVLQCVAVCCSVLQCVAVGCGVLQCVVAVPLACSNRQRRGAIGATHTLRMCVAVCHRELQ